MAQVLQVLGLFPMLELPSLQIKQVGIQEQQRQLELALIEMDVDGIIHLQF